MMVDYGYECPKHGEFQVEFEYGKAPRTVECERTRCKQQAKRVFCALFGRPYRAAGGNGSS